MSPKRSFRMNRPARILLGLLGGMAVLLAILLIFGNPGVSDLLELPAIGDGAAIDGLVVSAGGRTTRIDRTGDADWLFSPPAGARAARPALSDVLGLFETAIHSDIHSDVGDDPGSFGLDPAHAVSLTLTSSGRVVLALEIGAVQTFHDRLPDTFVRLPGGRSAFRVTGKDLRAPFDGGPYALRSRQMFSFGPGGVVGMDFFNPSAPDSRDQAIRLALDTGPGSAGLQGQELKSRRWLVVEPKGTRPGRLNVLAAQVAGLTVESWADALPADVRIDQASPRVVIHLLDGTSTTAAVSAAKDGFVWVASDTGFARVRDIDAACLVRNLADVRDPALLDIGREDIVGVEYKGADSGFSITRREGSFVVDGFPAFELDRAAVESWLGAIIGLTADAVVRPDGLAEAALTSPSQELRLRMRDGTARSVRFGGPSASGLVPAAVDGDTDVFMIAPANVAPALPGLDSLRRKNLLKAGPESVVSIVVSTVDGGFVRLFPPAGADQHWKALSAEGREVSSPNVTGIAAAVMSMSALAFVDVPAGSVRPDLASIEYRGRDFKLVVRISADSRDGGAVCAATGDRAFAGQAFIVPSAMVRAVLAAVNLKGL